MSELEFLLSRARFLRGGLDRWEKWSKIAPGTETAGELARAIEGPKFASPQMAVERQLEIAEHYAGSGVAQLGHALRGLDGSWDKRIPELAFSLTTSMRGWTCWMPQDVAAAVHEASKEIPDPGGIIGAGVIPRPYGVYWISDNGIRLVGDELPVRGISWSVEWFNDGEAVAPTVMPLFWVDSVEMGYPVPHWHQRTRLGSEYEPDVTAPPSPPPKALDWDHRAMDPLRWLLAAWVMTGQVFPPSEETPSRPLRRRAARAGMPPDWGKVNVVRFPRREKGGSGEGDVAWSHRWIVSGHWRWQPHGPKNSLRKLTWIKPYVKGPEDAPLVETAQVGKLVG